MVISLNQEIVFRRGKLLNLFRALRSFEILFLMKIKIWHIIIFLIRIAVQPTTWYLVLIALMFHISIAMVLKLYHSSIIVSAKTGAVTSLSLSSWSDRACSRLHLHFLKAISTRKFLILDNLWWTFVCFQIINYWTPIYLEKRPAYFV